jgi:hypothetical protein
LKLYRKYFFRKVVLYKFKIALLMRGGVLFNPASNTVPAAPKTNGSMLYKLAEITSSSMADFPHHVIIAP